MYYKTKKVFFTAFDVSGSKKFQQDFKNVKLNTEKKTHNHIHCILRHKLNLMKSDDTTEFNKVIFHSSTSCTVAKALNVTIFFGGSSALW